MTITEPRDGAIPSENVICPRCGCSLPSYAIFCGCCGTHIKKPGNGGGQASIKKDDDDALEQGSFRAIRLIPCEQELDETIRLPLQGNFRAIRLTPYKQELDETIRLPSLSTTHSASPLRGGTVIKSFWLLPHWLVEWASNNSLLRNSIFITGTGAATAVLGYFFWILATHLYSPHDVGLGAALISAISFASLIANLGIGSTLVQTLPRKESGHAWSLTLNAGLATGIVAGLLSGTIMVIALPLFSPQFAIIENHVGYAFAFIVGVPIMTISSLLDQVFIAERVAQNMLVRNAAVAVLKIPLLVLPVVLMLEVGTLGVFASGIVAMGAVTIWVLIVLVPRLGRGYCLTVRGIVGEIRSMLSLLTGNYFINLGGLATVYLMPLVVSIRLSAADNAYFYTTSRVGEFLLMGSAAVAASLLAEGSRMEHNLPQKVRSSMRIIAIMLAPGILVCFLGGYYILSIFGRSYAQHGLLLLRIDAISSIPDAITNIYVSVLRVQRRMPLAAGLNLGIAGVTVALTWILLPIMGIAGQGLAYLIAAGAGSLVAGIDALRFRLHG